MRTDLTVTIATTTLLMLAHGAPAVAVEAPSDEARPVEWSAEPSAERPAATDEPVWTLSARLRPRLESRFNHHFGLDADELNYVRPDTTDVFSTQIRLGVGVEKGELSAFVLAQYAGLWGVTGGDDLTDPTLGLHQGWLTWSPGDLWYLQAGRFELAYGDQRVLGVAAWNQVGRAWDGVRTGVQLGDAEMGEVSVDGFVTRYAEGTVDTDFADEDRLFEGDAYLAGVYASWDRGDLEGPVLRTVDLYALYDVQVDDPSADVGNARQLFGVGGRVALGWDLLDFIAEAVLQTGEACEPGGGGRCSDRSRDISAGMFDTELGATVYAPLKLRLFAGFGRATGDDPMTEDDEAYFPFYPPGHKWLGYTDIIGGRSNVQEIRGGLTVAIGPVKLRESIHHFSRMEPEHEAVGVELDSTVAVALHPGLELGAGHGLFVPDEGISRGDEDPDGLANWLFVQLTGGF